MEIPCSNLLDWLLNTGVLTAEWMAADEEATERLAALQSGRSSPAACPGVGPRDAGYREARRLLDACLHDPTLNQATLFGRYKDPYVDELYSIVSLWEKGGAHIGSLAARLVEDVKYELPSIRTTIRATEKQYATLGKRIEECEKSLSHCEKDYQTACRLWGIAGADHDQAGAALQQLEAKLPALVTRVEGELRQPRFDQCWEYYNTFAHANYCISHEKPYDTPMDQSASQSLSMIRDIRSETCGAATKGQGADHAAPSPDTAQGACTRRLELINELSELHAFFEMRVSELKEPDDTLFIFSETMNQAKKAYPLLNLTATEVLDLDTIVINILDMLGDPEAVRISSMVSRKDGLQKAEISLMSFCCLEERLRTECATCAKRRSELQDQLKELADRATEVGAHRKALKAELEAALPKVLSDIADVVLLES